jgi:hypothetical protein
MRRTIMFNRVTADGYFTDADGSLDCALGTRLTAVAGQLRSLPVVRLRESPIPARP